MGFLILFNRVIGRVFPFLAGGALLLWLANFFIVSGGFNGKKKQDKNSGRWND